MSRLLPLSLSYFKATDLLIIVKLILAYYLPSIVIPLATSSWGNGHGGRCESKRHLRDWISQATAIGNTVKQKRFCKKNRLDEDLHALLVLNLFLIFIPAWSWY
jgi:hypothetical protein